MFDSVGGFVSVLAALFRRSGYFLLRSEGVVWRFGTLMLVLKSLSWDSLSWGILSWGILSWDILSWDILSWDILSWDILS